MPANFTHCAALVREADRDRYLATLFAPAEHREALFALYAFIAEIARVRELAREPMPGEIRLQWWREVLEGQREGEAAAHPVAAALRATFSRYALEPERLTALIDAHAFDLYDEPMATLDELDNYAVGTQSALFAIACDILGAHVGETLTQRAAIASAIAGIVGDLARHAARHQLFLPLELLERHAVDREEIFAGQPGDRLGPALAELRRHARRQLAAGQAEFASAPAQVLPAFLPLALVGPTLRRMDRRDYEPFAFTPLSPLRRQWLIWRAARDPNRIFQA